MAYTYKVNAPYRFYGELVPSEKILPSHKKILETSITNHFLNIAKANEFASHQAMSQTGGQKAPSFRLQYAIGDSGTLIRAENGTEKKIVWQEKARKGWAKITRTVRYYQHLGYVKRDLSQDVSLQDSSKKTIATMKKGAEPSVKDHGYSMVRIGDNTLSFVKDVLSMRAKWGFQNTSVSNSFINNVGFASGSIWSFFAIKEVRDSVKEMDSAKAIGDEEGVRRAQVRFASGVTTLWGTGFYLSAKFMGLAGAGVETAATAFSYVSNSLFGLGSVIGIGMAGLGIYRCLTFTSRLNEYLENQDKDEAQRLKGTLRFLKDSMSVTPEEKKEITEKVDREHAEKTPWERQLLIDTELKNLTETKVKYMKRRTSHKSLSLLLNQVDKLIGQLDRGEGIDEANQLITTIKSENRKKLALYWISFFASVFGLIAVILSTLATGGVAPLVLLGISALVYIVLGGYHLGQHLFHRHTDVQEGVGLQIPAPDHH